MTTLNGAAQDRIRPLIQPPDEVMGNKQRDVRGSESALLSFPGDLGQHHMVLQFFRYHFEGNSYKKRSIDKTIALPIPLNLVEAINVSYAESELGAFQGAISDMVGRGDTEGAAKAVGDVLGTVEGFGKAAGEVIKGRSIKDIFTENRGGIDQASLLFRGGTGATAAGLNRFFGSAPNPHITALFQGVALRTHQFNWKLAPASEQETDTLSEIINSMRAAMLPGRGTNNLTLRFPDEVEIYLMGSNAKHMYHFKTAVIKTMSTNFAPDGVLSFFGKNGAPTAVTLDIDLTETSIHTREDYDGTAQQSGRSTVVDQRTAKPKEIDPNSSGGQGNIFGF